MLLGDHEHSTSEAGARFGIAHTWVLLVGIIGICVYAEMSGRVTAVSTRPVFDLVRERLGPRVALVNLLGSYLITLLTLAAEIGGVSLALQLLSGAPYLLWVPAVAVTLWLALWRVKFQTLERIFGLSGLALTVLVLAISGCIRMSRRCGRRRRRSARPPGRTGRRTSSWRSRCSRPR
jgi:Mn2+/Fe2+ NRAMP family transporter